MSSQETSPAWPGARRGAQIPRPRDAPASVRPSLEIASMLESASDAVVGISEKLRIVSWGAGAERLFGYPQAEALGQPVTILLPPDRLDEAAELVSRALAGRRVERHATKRLAKGGRLLDVLVSVSVIHGADERLSGVVGIFRDLSAERELEQALIASEQRYQSVVEALSEGVVMQDSDGVILAYNGSAERILGLAPGAIVEGVSIRAQIATINEDGTPMAASSHPSAVTMRTGVGQRDVVLGVEGPSSSTRWISVNSSPLVREGESTPYAAVTSFTDITDLRHTVEELREARFEDLHRLALVAEYRDDDTNRHTERVALAAERLALALGLDSDLVWTIRRAAPLHDVGKIGIPDSILLKPGSLTAEEFEVIKTHTVIGGRILCESRFPVVQIAMEIACTHHECWDGTGYPAGLAGETIPVTGRIVAVADAFDAMTHARPYKAALPVEHAVREIARCGGTQFDPQVVEAFMGLDHAGMVDPG